MLPVIIQKFGQSKQDPYTGLLGRKRIHRPDPSPKFPSFTDGAELWSGILAGKEEMREGTRAFFSKQKPDFRKFRR